MNERSERNVTDSLKEEQILDIERRIAQSAKHISETTNRGGIVSKILGFYSGAHNRISRDNISRSNSERYSCALIAETVQYGTMVIGGAITATAAFETALATAPICGTPALSVGIAGGLATIEVANYAGNRAENMCHATYAFFEEDMAPLNTMQERRTTISYSYGSSWPRFNFPSFNFNLSVYNSAQIRSLSETDRPHTLSNAVEQICRETSTLIGQESTVSGLNLRSHTTMMITSRISSVNHSNTTAQQSHPSNQSSTSSLELTQIIRSNLGREGIEESQQTERFSLRRDESIGGQVSSTLRQVAPIRQTSSSSTVNSTNALSFYAPPTTHYSSSNALSLSGTLGNQLAQLSAPRESSLARVAERLNTQRDTSSARYEEIKQSCAQAISSISTLAERTRPQVSERTNAQFILSTPSYQYVEHEPWPSFFQPDSSITLRVRPSASSHPASFFSNGSGDSTYHEQSSSGGDGHGSCVTTDGGCVTTESGSHLTTGYSW